jgi:hypothetical protein
MNDEHRALEAKIEHLEGLLNAAAHERHALLDRLGRYRTALARIADSESGHWGRIAHDALRNNDGETP